MPIKHLEKNKIRSSGIRHIGSDGHYKPLGPVGPGGPGGPAGPGAPGGPAAKLYNLIAVFRLRTISFNSETCCFNEMTVPQPKLQPEVERPTLDTTSS